MRALTTAATLLLATTSAFAADPPGKAIYDKNCAQCHGERGDGKGPAAPHLAPKPRDFTTGKFKIRTTPNGALPTDADLTRIVNVGMPYTSMPGWQGFLTPAEVQQVVEYVKTLTPAFKEQKGAPKTVDIPATPPASSAETIEKGGKIYASLGCAGCHGELGRGDGPSAPTLKDDLGYALRPANLSQPWTFRGGPTRTDIFRTLSTGLNGTPMPSFHDALKPEERWALADWIASLSPDQTPGYGTLVVATPSEEDIDISKGAAAFEKAKPVRFPVVGQIMEPGRAFAPGASSVTVRALYDQKRIAFLVQWDDTHADTTGKNAPDLAVPIAEEEDAGPAAAKPADSSDPWGDDAAPAATPSPAAGGGDFWGDEPAAAGAAAGSGFSDAVAIQLPAALASGVVKPYFIFGDGTNPVDLWFLDLAGPGNRVRQYVGRGSAALTALEGAEVEARGTFAKGTWSAVFIRDLRSTTGVSLAEDQFMPVSFSVWDGLQKERGNRRGLTQWFYVYLPPREQPSRTAPVAAAVGVVLLLEGLVVLGLRRRRKGQAAPPAA